MKSHILIKLRTRIYKQIPYWRQFILEKQRVITELHPEVDTLLSNYRLSIWVTHEYKPALEEWSYSELAIGLDRVYRIILQKERSIPPILIEKLSYLPFVEEVRMGEIVESSLPSIQLSLQKPLTDLRSRKSIYLPEAHELTEGDPRIIVAILDTGVFPDHLEYQDSLLPGMDFVNIIDGERKFIGDYLGYDEDSDDDVGHGTHVAGIISAKGYNVPKGVVPKCKILPVRVLGTMLQGNKRVGAGLVDNINTGIKWAIDHGADVINMSLGIQHQGGGLPHREMVDYAKHKGVTMVAASGNSGKEQLYYPGALPYVITVGAINEEGEVTAFSTYGKQVDLTAPGTNIYSTYLDHGYGFSTGTSHASPFVAGTVALLKSYTLKKRGFILSDSQVKYILKHSSDKVDSRFKTHKGGFGRLNLRDALRLLDYQLNK